MELTRGWMINIAEIVSFESLTTKQCNKMIITKKDMCAKSGSYDKVHHSELASYIDKNIISAHGE